VTSRGIHEAIRPEQDDLLVGRLRWIAEHDLEMGIGGDRSSAVCLRLNRDRADIDALVHRLEEAGERGGALAIGNTSRVCRHVEAIIGGAARPPRD